MANQQAKNIVLIALIKEASDFHILEKEGWYRIPVRTAPVNIKQGIVKYIAFYVSKKIAKDRSRRLVSLAIHDRTNYDGYR